MKRIFLFLMTNLAVLVVAGIALQLLGVESILDQNGVDLNLTALLIFSAVFGMAGSFISLALSKFMAKRAVGAQVIEQPTGQTEQWLFERINVHAQAAGIDMPEVAVYPSDTPNAFATGARRNHALIAVSTGLLRGMTPDEVDGVLAHEVSHVANGDMITMALVQGVVNTFVIFLSRVVGFFVDRVVLKNERGLGIGYYVTSIAAQIVFGILASTIVMWFSRQREFRADEGAARLAGSSSMIAALQRLQTAPSEPLPEALAAFGVNGGDVTGWKKFFLSHPPLEERIERLRQGGGVSA
jgi:heat shock protein HtpX